MMPSSAYNPMKRISVGFVPKSENDPERIKADIMTPK